MGKILVPLLIIVVLGVGFFALRSATPSRTVSGEQATSTPKVFTLAVENRKLVAGSSTIAVAQGDTVIINITVDEDEELHLHGYDQSVDLEKGKEGSLSFTAAVAGHFPFELEHSKTELGALDVLP